MHTLRPKPDCRDAIATEAVVNCEFCRGSSQPIYQGLTDRLSDIPGKWNFLKCGCGLVWLSPRPVPTDIWKAYQAYFTHEEKQVWYRVMLDKARRGLYASAVSGYGDLADGPTWRLIGAAMSLVPALKERALMGTMHLDGKRRGKLLDVGCGNGTFLARMREAGWDVLGIEPDPLAVKQAREQNGIEVIAGSLESANLAESSFDAVTLSHVIEHVYDPVALLTSCRRLLVPGGLVTILTPNVESFGHTTFASSWFALDPPRHLFLFSSKTLRTCCERSGLQVRMLRTSSRMGYLISYASETIREQGKFLHSAVTRASRIRAIAFEAREESVLRQSPLAGEELVLVASAV